MKKFLFVMLALIMSSAFAQSEMDMDMIDVDGMYQDKKVSPSDRMKVMRKKLEKRNEMMVKKKIEQMRLKQEIEMSKKLQQTFNKQMQAINSIQ